MTYTNFEVQKIQSTYIDELDIDHDLDQGRFEEFESDAGTLVRLFSALSISSSQKPPPKSTPRVPPRRELIWKYQKHQTVSLGNIERHFRDVLLQRSSTGLAFNRRRGRYTTKTAH